MKYKMTRKLILYFSAALLLFAVIVGLLFSFLFTNHTMQIHKEEQIAHAASIADTLSALSSGEFSDHDAHSGDEGYGRGYGYGMGYGQGKAGYGRNLKVYLSFIDDIAMGDVWLVDEKAQTIQMGHNSHDALSYDELPPGAESLIQQVFSGHLESSEEFSALLETPSVTVGAPVRDANGTVVAALLLHSPVAGVNKAEQDGFLILAACMLAAMLLAAALSVVLASHFIGPLRKMQAATGLLMEGDYAAKTGVKQNDEIGSLAENIDQLSIRLAKAQTESSKLEILRRDFISNISHELRTPVTVLKGSLEVLSEGLVSEPSEVQAYYQQMLADTTHLERLVNDLLELSRLQNMDFQIEKSEINLFDVVEEVIRSMGQMAQSKKVKLSFINEIGSFPFLGDYGRLRQMILVVLDNAIKFSPAGMSVILTAKLRGNICSLSVQDQGAGILPEDLPHIFDRFYHKRSEQNKMGTGLGLSIAKEIAARHSIEIICDSQPETGTVFSFLFPDQTTS